MQSFWETSSDGELSINSKRYQEIKEGLEVKHYNKLPWNHKTILKIIENNKQYSTRKVITLLEMYYWKHNNFEEFIKNIEGKLNLNILNVSEIIL